MDNIYEMDIQRAGLQVLETAYIIGTSKNIDTIKSRYLFLVDKLEVLKKGQINSQYITYSQSSLESYKRAYFDKVVQDYQHALLYNPNEFNLTEFYCNSLGNAMKRYCLDEIEEISSMKRESAKVKRKAKAIDVLKSAKGELKNKCSSASSYSITLIELEKLVDLFDKST